MSKDPAKNAAKQEQAVKPVAKSVEQSQTAAKAAPKKAARRRQTGDFWINLSVGLFISICLLILGFELLVKIAH